MNALFIGTVLRPVAIVVAASLFTISGVAQQESLPDPVAPSPENAPPAPENSVPSPAEAMPAPLQSQGGPAPAAKPAEDAGLLPAAIPFEHYRSLIDASPFAPATPPVAPEAPKPSFAQNLFLSGAGKMGNKDYVAVASRSEPKRYTLFLGEPGTPGSEGMVLEKVEWASERGKTKATIRLGAEVAVIEFDQAAVGAAPAAGAHQPPPVAAVPARAMPGMQPPRPLGAQPQIGMPGALDPSKTTQRRRVRIVAPPAQ